MVTNTTLLYLILSFVLINLFSKSIGNTFLSLFNKKRIGKWSPIELVEAIDDLSKKKIGAIIAFERTNSLKEFIKTAEEINANINKELIISIFQKRSPLHDGGVIISGGKIQAASAYFPTSNKKIAVKYGARHRAALGLSAKTDAFVIVVSESTGKIAVANKGQLEQITLPALSEKIQELV